MQQPPSGYGAPPPQNYAPQGYGPAPGFPPPKKKMGIGMIVLIVFCCIFGSCVMCGVVGSIANKNGTAASASGAATAPNATAAANAPATPGATPKKGSLREELLAHAPDSEKTFCTTVMQFVNAYKAAPSDNELKRSKVRGGRAQALKALPANVSGWLGTIDHLSTQGDGKAVLSVKLPCDESADIEVKTWNNAMSDISDNTLIPQSSSMFDTLSDLGSGKPLMFSGSFFSGNAANGFEESSLSEQGSMSEPEFIFRFTQVKAPQPQ